MMYTQEEHRGWLSDFFPTPSLTVVIAVIPIFFSVANWFFFLSVTSTSPELAPSVALRHIYTASDGSQMF